MVKSLFFASILIGIFSQSCTPKKTIESDTTAIELEDEGATYSFMYMVNVLPEKNPDAVCFYKFTFSYNTMQDIRRYWNREKKIKVLMDFMKHSRSALDGKIVSYSKLVSILDSDTKKSEKGKTIWDRIRNPFFAPPSKAAKDALEREKYYKSDVISILLKNEVKAFEKLTDRVSSLGTCPRPTDNSEIMFKAQRLAAENIAN